MSLAALEDDGEATYTHFAHRAELEKLLAKLLEDGASKSEQELDGLVKGMGAVVSVPFGEVTDSSLTTTFRFLVYSIQRSMRSSHL